MSANIRTAGGRARDNAEDGRARDNHAYVRDLLAERQPGSPRYYGRWHDRRIRIWRTIHATGGAP